MQVYVLRKHNPPQIVVNRITLPLSMQNCIGWNFLCYNNTSYAILIQTHHEESELKIPGYGIARIFNLIFYYNLAMQ